MYNTILFHFIDDDNLSHGQKLLLDKINPLWSE